MNQKLVTKKNRKVRLLKEHHPEINCKIFYQRDYLHLLIKYGLEPPEWVAAFELGLDSFEPLAHVFDGPLAPTFRSVGVESF